MDQRLSTLTRLEISFERTERTYIRLILGSVAAFVLFVALCWVGFHFYSRWQERHLVRRAAGYMSGGDLKTASLTVRRALQINPDDPAANRLLAEIAEKAHDRSAIDLRRKVFEANPSSIDDALALVRAALWFNDLATAEKTLAQIEPQAKDNALFQAASGRVAETKKDFAAAETHWGRAVELAPNESGYRFQLAFTRLSLNDPAKRADALAMLEQLRSDPARRAAATRTLMLDAISHHEDPQRVRAMGEELQGYSDANFSDRMMYLEILRQLNDPAFDSYLDRLKHEAAGSAENLASLMSWMVRNRRQNEVLEFAQTLPEKVTNEWPVPWVLAEARAQLKQWTQLEQQVRDADWGQYNFLRRAYLSRALRGQSRALEADQELTAAQQEASADPQMILLLTQTIADWGWQNEALEMLWVLTRNPQTKMAALRTLYEHYTRTGDTSGLYRTLTKLIEARPDDMALQNNLAQLSLLIDADVDRARRIAADLVAKEPKNPNYVSTYAFSLLTNGDVKEALGAMERLDPKQLEQPAIATYYGLVLAAAGQKEKARSFLARSAEATLLPEEKALVAKAQSNL